MDSAPPTSRPPSSLTTTLGLSPLVSPLNVLSLLSHSFLMISFLVYLNAAQPFLLDLLHLPSSESGSVTGRLILFDQVTALLLALVWGAVADRTGIRLVIPLGYALVAAGLGAYGGAQSVGQLLPFRMMFAAGASALTATLSTTLGLMSAAPTAEAEVDEEQVAAQSSGDDNEPLLTRPTGGGAAVVERKGQLASRMAGLVGLGSGAGALLAVFGYLRLPTTISALFPSTSEDGLDLRLTFAFTAFLALCEGAFLIYGLKIKQAPADLKPTADEDGPDPATIKRALADQIVHAIKELPRGFYLARRDPQIALSFGAAFAARAASIVIAAYISLVVNLYFTKHGLCDPASTPSTLLHALEGSAKETCRPAYILSSILSGTAQLCALLFAPFAGLLAAKWSPALVLLSTSLLGALSFPLFGWGEDPRSGWGILAAVGIGISEISAAVVSLGMLANARGRLMQEGGTKAREMGGALGAAYSVCGGLGILIVGRLGGGLISISPGAPFFIMGAVNAILVVGSLAVYIRAG